MKVSIDSRTIKPGEFFIPVKGTNFDGKDFIHQAIKKGGILLDVDLWKYAENYRKKLRCHVIGITGSAGKTTYKDMLASVLSQGFNVQKTKENLNNEYGVPLTLLSADSSTDILIVEMGLRKKGDIKFLTKLVQPSHTVITCIGMTHIEFFDSQKQLAQAKAEIFQKQKTWQICSRFSFLNFNTPYYDLLQKKASTKNYHIIPFKGDNKIIETINCCYEIGHHFGLSPDKIQAGIDSFHSSSQRLKVKKLQCLTCIDDSYNANPDGVVYALQFLNQFEGRKILILGDMLELGTFSQDCHKQIIPFAIEQQINLILTYGPISQCMQSDQVDIYNFTDRSQLHTLLKSECKQGDIILVKGSRGLHMEKTVEFIESQFA